jgi:hypothetical protein
MGVVRGEEPRSADAQTRMVSYNVVSGGYFAAMRTPLLGGRDFRASDAKGGAEVAIINPALANVLWPGTAAGAAGAAGAVGRRVRVIDRGDRTHDIEIVGVASDSKFTSLAEAPQPVLYLPSTQWYRQDMRLLVRASGNPAALASAVRAVVRDVNPDIPALATTMEAETAFTLVPARLAGSVLALAGAIGLLLAAIGVFGVISYSVAREGREIGIRMALGASGPRVVAMFVRRGLRLTLIGLALGLVAALGATRLLRGMLYGVSPTDPASFAVVLLGLLGVSLLACYLPARLAARVAPAVVLRSE